MSRLHVCPRCEANWSASLRVDHDRNCVSWDGGEVKLRPYQAQMLRALVDGCCRVVRRSRLVDAIWGDKVDGGPENANGAVNVHMHYLRRSLRQAGFPGSIRTEPRVGYELVLAA